MGQRHRRHHAVAGPERERGRDRGCLGRDVRVRQDDGLGRPARSGGELHERGTRKVGGGGDARARDQRQPRQSVDGEGGRRAPDRGRHTRRIGVGGHDQLGRETGRDRGELDRSERRRDQHDRRPAAPGRQERGNQRSRRIQRQSHDAALTEPGPRERREERGGGAPELAAVQRAVGVDDPGALKRMGECHASQARRGSDHRGTPYDLRWRSSRRKDPPRDRCAPRACP